MDVAIAAPLELAWVARTRDRYLPGAGLSQAIDSGHLLALQMPAATASGLESQRGNIIPTMQSCGETLTTSCVKAGLQAIRYICTVDVTINLE